MPDSSSPGPRRMGCWSFVNSTEFKYMKEKETKEEERRARIAQS